MATYEYGLFNSDKEKICAVADADPNNPDWAFLWEKPFTLYFDEKEAEYFADQINNDRVERGLLESHGKVDVQRRRVTYGDWQKYDRAE